MGAEVGTAKLTYPLEIRWHGRGGQGAVTAAKLLAETALGLGKQVQAFPQFGSERRGAPIIAFTRIDEKPITLYTTILEPNILIVLDESLLELPGVTSGLQADGLLLVNSASPPAGIRKMLRREAGTVATVPATAIATEHLGRPVTNTAMLGAFLAATGILRLQDVLAHVRLKFSEEFSREVVEGNLRAMTEAYERVDLQ
jgi:2-oxoacid:acceptor oxidoreductase gamma subunit (pyruvate/2-ketoisovalerate family)